MTTAEERAVSLPEGWIAAPIGQACALNPGKPAIDALPKGAMVSFVPMPAVDEDLGAITNPQERPYTDVRTGFTSFQDEDVIFAKITPCMENGKAAIARNLKNGLGFGSTEFHVLRPNGVALPEYLYYFVRQQSFRDAAAEEMTGSVGQKRVPTDYLRNVIIPLPPLAEQERIITKLGQLLVGVQASRDRLDRVLSIVKRLRQSTLDAAMTGALTLEWRDRNETAGNAKDELASFLEAAEIHRPRSREAEPTEGHDTLIDAIPESWETPTLDDLFRLIDYRGKTPKKSTSGKRLISAKNIKMGYISEDPVEYVSEETYQSWMTRGFPKKGDIFFVTEGHTMGFAALNERTDEFALAQRTITLQPWQPIDTRCYLFFLMSSIYQTLVVMNATGSAAVGIKAAKFRGLPIPFPPISEQQQIANRVESVLKWANMIERRVTNANMQAGKLGQTILAKAFRGELVPTEAELARLEGRDYEPAAKLLERTKQRVNPLTKPKRAGKAKVMTTRSSKKSGERKPLRTVLEEAKKGLSSEDLFEQSGFDDEAIEDFYRELREGIANGWIVEERPNNTDVVLKAV